MLVMALLVFAKQHRLRVELGCANQVLQEASLTDPLTGCRNRRFFDLTIFGETSQVLRSYANRQSHHASDLILYMIDLDDFKEINDRYGHGAGDKVLTDMCKRIRTTIRNSDILIRWGGDEFLIVSRNSNRTEAANFAGRILNAVGGKRAALSSEGSEIHQTCSIGWAAFPWYTDQPDEVPLEAVLGLADRGVYEAKVGGKNRAIGISSADQGAVFLVTTGSDRVSSYCLCKRFVSKVLLKAGLPQRKRQTRAFPVRSDGLPPAPKLSEYPNLSSPYRHLAVRASEEPRKASTVARTPEGPSERSLLVRVAVSDSCNPFPTKLLSESQENS